MLNTLRTLFRGWLKPTEAEIAYRARLRIRLSGLLTNGADAVPAEPQAMIGELVGHTFLEALATRAKLHRSLSPLDRTSLTLRLTYACFAVSTRAGVRLDANMVASALTVLHPRFVATDNTLDLIRRCAQQVPKWRLSSRQPEPTAEETMVLRYIDRGELLVLQALGKQLEREVHAARVTRATRLRKAAATVSQLRN